MKCIYIIATLLLVTVCSDKPDPKTQKPDQELIRCHQTWSTLIGQIATEKDIQSVDVIIKDWNNGNQSYVRWRNGSLTTQPINGAKASMADRNLFKWASVSKLIFAGLYLQSGSLNDPVSKSLVNNPPLVAGDLLNHTSGFSENLQLIKHPTHLKHLRGNVDFQTSIKGLLKTKRFKKGQFRYSGTNTAILTTMLLKKSGFKTPSALIQKMKSQLPAMCKNCPAPTFGFLPQLKSEMTRFKNGHRSGRVWSMSKNKNRIDTHPASGLSGSVYALATIIDELLPHLIKHNPNGVNFKSGKDLITEPALRKQKHENSSKPYLRGYGFGADIYAHAQQWVSEKEATPPFDEFMKNLGKPKRPQKLTKRIFAALEAKSRPRVRGHFFMGHHGALDGFESYVLYSNWRNVSLILLANGYGFENQRQRLLDKMWWCPYN